jgi:hypothetical protein
MHVSWSDLNNVADTGDFPFRDGRITVTVAELAMWKENPQATFLLMRKNPARGAPSYVLGQLVADRSEKAREDIFYKSSNGDTWSLTRDPTTGEPVVKHTPNLPSGGTPSHIDIASFLANGANGPEHQALRNATHDASGAATVLIAYDIHRPSGAAFDDLVTAIKSLGAWWHHLETIWIVRSTHSPAKIRDELKPFIGADDQLLIIDVSDDKAGWAGISDTGSAWLSTHIANGNRVSAEA